MTANRDQLSEVEQELEKIKKRQAELQAQQQFLEANPEVHVAEVLHARLCHSDHTDMCGWMYEDWGDKLGSTRRQWVEKAKRVLAVTDIETALKVMDAIRG